ncbi:glycosyltransferase family 4 protein [Nocardioides alkalitolerans]|uniref:glycosyltransferase family 4 protein n=1 Tax=Nocardioides alkalitolerans TaxID=281714 RepID=UPI003CCBA87E
MRPTLLAGSFEGDEPLEAATGPLALARVRRLVPSPGFTGVFSFRLATRAIAEVRACDLAHVSVSRELGPVWVILVLTVLRRPWVAQTHGMLTARSSKFHRSIDLFLRPLLRRSGGIIALTEQEAESVRGWLGEGGPCITVLGNPVAAAPARVPDDVRGVNHRREVIWIARLHRRKRVSTFAAAAARAGELGRTEAWTVVGPDEGDEAFLRRQVALNKNLSYEGSIPGGAVAARLDRANVFVLTSEAEPWGNVLALALSLRMPVVVPESAALARTIEEYGAGLVFADGDHAALAHQVSKILDDETLRSRLSVGAGNLSEQVLGRERQLATLRSIYKSVVDRTPF